MARYGRSRGRYCSAGGGKALSTEVAWSRFLGGGLFVGTAWKGPFFWFLCFLPAWYGMYMPLGLVSCWISRLLIVYLWHPRAIQTERVPNVRSPEWACAGELLLMLLSCLSFLCSWGGWPFWWLSNVFAPHRKGTMYVHVMWLFRDVAMTLVEVQFHKRLARLHCRLVVSQCSESALVLVFTDGSTLLTFNQMKPGQVSYYKYARACISLLMCHFARIGVDLNQLERVLTSDWAPPTGWVHLKQTTWRQQCGTNLAG